MGTMFRRTIERRVVKTCSRCLVTQDEATFGPKGSGVSGTQYRNNMCNPCRNSYRSETINQDQDAPLTGKFCLMCDTTIRGSMKRLYCSGSCSTRARTFRARYGLSAPEYRALIAANGGACPICKKSDVTSWHIDHSHVTGLVYGAVCARCNTTALVGLSHDLALARSIVAYLENPPALLAGVESVARKSVESKLHYKWAV